MIDIEILAERIYEAYCDGVGGVAFNGDKLPTWAEFAADETKQKQADAWRNAAMAALDMFP